MLCHTRADGQKPVPFPCHEPHPSTSKPQQSDAPWPREHSQTLPGHGHCTGCTEGRGWGWTAWDLEAVNYTKTGFLPVSSALLLVDKAGFCLDKNAEMLPKGPLGFGAGFTSYSRQCSGAPLVQGIAVCTKSHITGSKAQMSPASHQKSCLALLLEMQAGFQPPASK